MRRQDYRQDIGEMTQDFLESSQFPVNSIRQGDLSTSILIVKIGTEYNRLFNQNYFQNLMSTGLSEF